MAFNHELPFTQFNDLNLDWLINEVKNNLGTALTGVLSAGETTLTLESSVIVDESVFDIYTSVYGLAPTSATSGSGYITLTFAEQDEDVNVKVIVRNY